jgi:hypothetical protein
MEIWELVARESVRDLIVRYNANGDSGRWDQLEQLFAPDAVMEVDGVRHEGRDAIMAMFRSVQQRVVAPDGDRDAEVQRVPAGGHTTVEEWVARGRKPFIRHFTATTQIDVLAPDDVRARSYYQLITVHGLDHWGLYLDRFTTVDGEWRFAHRREIQEATVEGGWGVMAGLDNVVRVIGSAPRVTST